MAVPEVDVAVVAAAANMTAGWQQRKHGRATDEATAWTARRGGGSGGGGGGSGGKGSMRRKNGIHKLEDIGVPKDKKIKACLPSS